MMIEIVVGYVIVLVWGIGTTLLGLWLSWKNNFKYNADILRELNNINMNLEEIKHGIDKLRRD